MELQQLKESRQQIAEVGGVQPLDWTLLRIHGNDAGSFLHKMTTNDIRKLADGDVRECFVTDIRGKIIGHGFFLRLAEDNYLFLGAGQQAESLQTHWQRFIISEDVQFDDLAEKMPACAGTRSLVTDAPSDGGLLSACDVMLCGVPVKQIRVPVYGDDNAIFLVKAEDITILLDNAGVQGAANCAADSWETLRVEAGFPVYGVDISDENLPQEVSRNDSAISFEKGCYLGQETVARIDAMGHVNWYLVGLRSTETLAPHSEALVDGKVVARIGSVVLSPSSESTLALGYVRRGYETAGTQLQTDVGQLQVCTLPAQPESQE